MEIFCSCESLQIYNTLCNLIYCSFVGLCVLILLLVLDDFEQILVPGKYPLHDLLGFTYCWRQGLDTIPLVTFSFIFTFMQCKLIIRNIFLLTYNITIIPTETSS